MLNLHPLTIPDKLIHIEWKVLLAHFSSFVALHQQWQDLEAGRVPYTIFLPDPKVSVGFTTIGRLLKPAVSKQDRPKPKACSGKDCQRCDKTQTLLCKKQHCSELWLCRRISICSAALRVLLKVTAEREREREMHTAATNGFLAVAGHSVKQWAHFLVIPWSEALVKKGPLLPPH